MFLIGFVFWYSLNLSVILSLYSSFSFFLSLKRSCSNLRRILNITGTTFRDCLERIKLLLVLCECVEKFIIPLVPRSKDDQVGTEDISAFFMPKQNNISCRDMVHMSSTNIWTLWLERNTWLLYSGHWCFRKLTNADMFESFIDLSETNKFGVNSQKRFLEWIE